MTTPARMLPRGAHRSSCGSGNGGRFGVDLRAEHRLGRISGGQAQRVALCRALLRAPRILLADEPTANLDQTSADVVVGTLHQRATDGGTVIVASHDPRLVDRCARQIVL